MEFFINYTAVVKRLSAVRISLIVEVNLDGFVELTGLAKCDAPRDQCLKMIWMLAMIV